ncbi:MAG: sugar transferase [Ruminococcaceae bacterium]|nr:sugar transferase [Oscillospiraceae bacterium]
MKKSFFDLPYEMRSGEVKEYFDILDKRRGSLFFKRAFDIFVSLVMLIVSSPLLAAVAIAIKCDSKGPVFFRQLRITENMREFRIFKFRTMVDGADKKGPLVTVDEDKRITKTGAWLRKTRLDEVPQLINVLLGDMTFVGTRPEVKKYVDAYTNEMTATLLMKAGVTSPASIAYKDEALLLKDAGGRADEIYINEILPEKMKYNLNYIRNFSFFGDIKIMFGTVFAVAKD